MYQQNMTQQGFNQQHQHVPLQDADLSNTVLNELKRVAREYATACLEASNPDIRQLFEQLLHQTMRDQEHLYQTINQLNMYGQPSSADQNELLKEVQNHQQQLGNLQGFMQQWQQGANRGGQTQAQAGYRQNAYNQQPQQYQQNQQIQQRPQNLQYQQNQLNQQNQQNQQYQQYQQYQQNQQNQQNQLHQQVQQQLLNQQNERIQHQIGNQEYQRNQQNPSIFQQLDAQDQRAQQEQSRNENQSSGHYGLQHGQSVSNYQPITQQHHSSAAVEAVHETGSEPASNHITGATGGPLLQ